MPIIKQLFLWKPTINIYSRNKEGLSYLLAGGHIEGLQYSIAERGPLDFLGIDICSITNQRVRNLFLGINTDMNWLSTFKESGDLECPICKLDCQMHIETQCGHKYCQDCITSWLERSICCPYCRRVII